jgi:hypothetical protein
MNAMVADQLAEITAQHVDRAIETFDPTKVDGVDEKVITLFRRDISLAFIELLRNAAIYEADHHRVLMEAAWEACDLVAASLCSSMRFYGLDREQSLCAAGDTVMAAVTERVREGIVASIEMRGE